MKLTAGNISRLLSKAGETKAEYECSGQVRGWGTWSHGFSSSKHAGGPNVRVEYHTGSWANPDPSLKRNTDRIAAIIREAGFDVTEHNSDLVVSEKVPA